MRVVFFKLKGYRGVKFEKIFVSGLFFNMKIKFQISKFFVRFEQNCEICK